MSAVIFDNITYSVAFAEQRNIGLEWNLVKWNKHLSQIQYHRLYFLTSGEATLYLLDKTIKLTPEMVYFIPAFSVLHSEIADEMNKYYIHFQASSPMFDIYRYINGNYSVPKSPITKELFQIVVDNYRENTNDAFLKVQGAMNLILSDFFKDLDTNRYSINRFENVLTYINDNYKSNISLETLSSLMHINTLYFSNLFKQIFHISPRQYILNKKLTESQRLLLESDMSVKEISYSVGFSNANYFSEFFSSKIGISPLKFRNRNIPKTKSSIL